MTTEHPGDDAEHMAEVVPLRAENAHTETAFGQATGPAYLDTSGTGEAKRHPIIPEHLRRDRIRQTIGEVAGLHWYKARYHGFRSPAYAAKTLWYAVRGVFRLAGALLAWANWADGWVLESLAVAAGRLGPPRRDERPHPGPQDPGHPLADRRRGRGGRGGRPAGHGPLAALVGLAGSPPWPRSRC